MKQKDSLSCPSLEYKTTTTQYTSLLDSRVSLSDVGLYLVK